MAVINDLEKKPTTKSYENLYSLKKTANYLFTGNKYKSSLQYYKRIIKQWPREIPEILLVFEKKYTAIYKDSELGLSLAALYRLEDNPQEAIYIYEDLLESDPLNLNIYTELTRTLQKQKKYTEIIKYIEKPYQLAIYDEEIAHSLAIAYVEIGQSNKAINVYEKLIEINGEKENYLRTLSDLYFNNNYLLRAAQMAEKRISLNKNSHGDVIPFIKKCRDKLEQPDLLNTKLIDIYIQYAYYSEALELLREYLVTDLEAKKIFIDDKLFNILKSSPDMKEALLLRAEFYSKTERYSEAADDYKKLISNSHFEKKAITGLENIIILYPTQVSALQYLADHYEEKGETHLVLEYMRKLMNADISKSIGVLKQCQDVIENNPKNYYAKLTMAEAYLKNDNYHEAIAIAKELLSKGEDKDSAYKILIHSYSGNRDFASLREIYNQARISIENKLEFHQMYQDIYSLELSLRKDFFRNKAKNSNEISDKLNYIKAMIENKQFSDALIKIQDISKIDINYKLFYYQALAFIGLGNFYSAIVSLKKSLSSIFIETSPEYLQVLEKLGELYEMIGSIDLALEKYSKILEIDFTQEKTKNREKILKNCPCLEVSGKSLIVVPRNSDGSDVLVMFNRNILKNKQKEHFESSMGVASNNEAVEDILKGKLASASDRLKIAEQMDASHKNILNNKAVLSLLEKNHPEALKIFERILKSRKASSTAAYYHIGFILTYHLKKYKEAKSLLKKLVQVDEDFYEAYLLLGDICFHEDNIEEATEYWAKYKENGLLKELAAYRLLDVNYII